MAFHTEIDERSSSSEKKGHEAGFYDGRNSTRGKGSISETKCIT